MIRHMLMVVLLATSGCTLNPTDWEVDDWRPQYKGCKLKIDPSGHDKEIKIKCKNKVSWLGS